MFPFPIRMPPASCGLFVAAMLWCGQRPASAQSRLPVDPVDVGRTLAVENGEHARFDAILSTPIRAGIASVRLVEITAEGDREVASQIEAGASARLWWIARGPVPPRSKRTYRIDKGVVAGQRQLAVDRTARAFVVSWEEGSAPPRRIPVLQYNHAHVAPPAGIAPPYGRSAYIHPVHSPAGVVVTDEFPPDHAHQSGVFLAYTKTRFEDREPNFWELANGKGRVRYKAFHDVVTLQPVFGQFRVEQEHLDETAAGGKVALNETWAVRVWTAGGPERGYWTFDVESKLQCATESPLKLPQYHYGGMALRGARSWGGELARFTTADGQDRWGGNHSRTRWCDLSGSVASQRAGLAMLTHPTNFRFPEPLRIHPTMPYMVYTPSQLGDWEIRPGRPHVSRYRFLIHDGDLPRDVVESAWRDFAEPLVVHVLP